MSAPSRGGRSSRVGYIPADTILKDHAANVETELRYMARQGGEDEGLGELDEVERRLTEKGEVLDFEPLSADVAPQMSLFGPAFGDPEPSPAGAPTRPAAAAPTRPGAGRPGATALQTASASAEADAGVPAFERRAKLRAKRHKLVAELARDLRSTHKAVNAQVNGAFRIESVDKATIEQLERSIEWLDAKLYGPKR